MMRALWASATGMTAQQMNMDNIANNLANVNTTGFKRSQTNFQDLIYDRLKAPGATGDDGTALPGSVQLGLGTHLVAVNKVYSPGKAQQTGNVYDQWIEGNGFFQVKKADGTTSYTRDGSFRPNATGKLVTADGYELVGVNAIDPTASSFSVSPNGVVSQQVGSTNTQLGQIQLYNFANPAGLLSEGRNLMQVSAASGEAVAGTPGSSGFGTLQQGYLEMSNVEVVQEMVNLIVAQRAYEVNVKAIQASDEMLQTANNIRR